VPEHGGIANVTVVTDRLETVRAFDLGPRTCRWTSSSTPGPAAPRRSTATGARAARGRPDPALVAELLRHPYFELPPPKSTGREAFGDVFVKPLLARYAGREGDLLASLTRFVAESVAGGIRRWVPEPVAEVLVSGGGARNATLMAALATALGPVPVRSLAEVGLDPDAKEAVAFAAAGERDSLRPPWQTSPGATGPRQARGFSGSSSSDRRRRGAD
jgi:anhydro-N-acetylmuramic acid kinase